MSDIAIAIKNGTKKYGSFTVFSQLNLEVPKNKIMVLHGPSGCGKTTLLLCLAALESLNEGTLSIENTVIAEEKKIVNEIFLRKKLGIVFQDFYLWDNKKALDNITESLIYVRKLPKETAQTIALKKSQELHVDIELLQKYPPELSRGQRQRIAIIRTLVMEPEILLFDEASASLDEYLIDQLVKTIRYLKETGKTIFIVTHDTSFANKVGDVILDFKQLILSPF